MGTVVIWGLAIVLGSHLEGAKRLMRISIFARTSKNVGKSNFPKNFSCACRATCPEEIFNVFFGHMPFAHKGGFRA